MVRYWDFQIDRAIRNTKFLIKHYEKHGCGNNAMEEKARLVKQERHKKVREEKIK